MYVREARERMALSQEDLAELAGVHARSVGRVELGLVKPSPRTRRAVARALGLSPAELEFPGVTLKVVQRRERMR